MTPDDDWSLAEARAWLRARVDDGDRCPCCEQHAQVYRWSLYAGAVWLLVRMYRAGGTEHFVESRPLKQKGQGGDCTRLALWGLVVHEPERRPDGGKSGWWIVTQLGEDFLRGRTTIPKYVYVYNGVRLARDGGGRRSVRDALGKDFDYDEYVRWNQP